EDELALAEPAPLAEEELALAPEPVSPVEAEPGLIEETAPVEEPALTAEPATIEADVAASEPPEPAPPEEEEIASAEPIDRDLPLAAQAPLPSDLDPLLEDEAADTVPDAASTDIASAEPSSDAASLEPASPGIETPLPSDRDPFLDDEALDAAPDDAATDVASAELLPSSEETISEPAPAVETAIAEPASAEPVPSSGEISGAIDGADLASSEEPADDEHALFGTPVSWAFMDLGRAERAEIQARLQATGLYEGSAEGAWDQATLAAMETFLTSEEGASFDSTTQTGASLALDFIRSDAYAEAHGLPPGEPEADPNDPLASTDW
ncbi:MAG TPA: hypothetical protein VM899_16245, partial [Rubellimicrobium sp.]|nr:hypothetical protein [Rubellimicrobium sp.]